MKMTKSNTENFDVLGKLDSIEEVQTIKIDIPSEKKYETIEYTHHIKQLKKRNSFLSGIIFLTKYVLTTSLIFAILIASVNYSAYVDIAKNYIFAGNVEVTKQKLISSVEAANIKEKYEKEKIEKIEEEKIEQDKLSIKKMKKQQDRKNINLNIEITPYENRLVIPRMGKNIPLIDVKNRSVAGESELNAIFMKELENGVVRYPGSAKPGEKGNSFVFGHSSNFPWIKGNYNEVFATLDNVVYGDKIIVYYGQKKYTYIVREKKIVDPGDTSVLKRNKNKSEITLMGCWPIGTTLKRLLVIGELVEEN